MRLAIVPQIEVPDPSLGEGVSVLRPDLPQHVLTRAGAWGQASSRLESRKRVVIWLNVSEEEAEEISKRSGCVVKGATHPSEETTSLRNGMCRGSRAARLDFIESYRTVAKAIEEAEDRRDALKRLGKLVAILGAVTVTDLVLRGLLHLPPGLTLAAVIATDNCDGTNGSSFHGLSTTTGGKTWATFLGADWMQVQSNTAYSTNSGIAWLSDMSDTADVYAQCTAKTNNAGPYIRISTSGNTEGYWIRHNNSNVDMYRAVPGSTYVQLGSNGSSPGTNPLLRIEASGSSISGYLNGVLDIGPVTDTNRTTGKCGAFILESGKSFDDWEAGTLSSASGAYVPRKRFPRSLLSR